MPSEIEMNQTQPSRQLRRRFERADIAELIQTNDVAAQRAVCALFRQQTADEKEAAVTRHRNRRGFTATEARVGTEMAVWMTRGCADGVMRRRVGGRIHFGDWLDRVEACRKIAMNHLGQLARIANGEL